MQSIPQISLGVLQVSRLIVGGNPFSGNSHQSGAVDREMLDYYTATRIRETLAACESCGLNALVARADQHIMRTLREYWNAGGRIQWLAQTAPEIASMEDNIRRARFYRASACYIHGGVVDQRFESGELESLRRPLALIRELGMVPGIAAHQPQAHLEAQRLELGHVFHMVSFYNVAGRQGRIEVADEGEKYLPEDRDAAIAALQRIVRPCLAYKVFAAGRNDPREALAYAYRHIRRTDAVVMGVYTRHHPDQIEESVRIALECMEQGT